MCDLGPAISTPIQISVGRAWRLNHRQWMVIMDSFRSLILPCFFWIGVNGRRHFGRRPVVTLRVSYRFMAQTALEPLIYVGSGLMVGELTPIRKKRP